MANTLTVMIPTLVASLQRVLRRTGAVLNGVDLNAAPTTAGKDQTINLPGTAALSDGTITPANTVPALVNTTPTAVELRLDQLRGARFHLTGEEFTAMGARGAEFQSTQIDDAIAAVVDTMTSHICTVAANAAGLAFGTSGTNPFASTANIVADLMQYLDTNKAPSIDRFLIMNPAAKAALFKLALFQQRNTSPDVWNFASGQMGELLGFWAGMDQSIIRHTKGAGTGHLVDGATAAGATTITLKTGTLAVLPGDVVTFAADTVNKYVVKTGAAFASAGGDIVLTSPLLVDIPDNNAMTINNDHAANLAMHKSAVAVGMRPPAEPPGGDVAADVAIISDPQTGVSLRLAHYPGYHLGQWEVSALYGAVVRRPALIAKMLG